MNGLKYIRTRCNLSLNDLAEAIGVSRQALSAWENERKEIPKQRKKDLSDYFGIDESYFGEITEKEKRFLLEKAMFRYGEDGKETYRYKPKENDLTCVFFMGDSDKSLDEEYVDMQKQKKNLLKEIEKAIIYSENAGGIQSQIVCMKRGCEVYGVLTLLMQEMKKQQMTNRMPYYYEIINVLKGTLVAFDLLQEKEIKENIEINKELQGEDGEWILELSGIIKERWRQIKERQEKLEKDAKGNIKVEKNEPAKPIDKQIFEAENLNREFMANIGEKLHAKGGCHVFDIKENF